MTDEEVRVRLIHMEAEVRALQYDKRQLQIELASLGQSLTGVDTRVTSELDSVDTRLTVVETVQEQSIARLTRMIQGMGSRV
jgi:hypothetical protein